MQKLTITIDTLGGMGDGIAQHNGQAIYVPYTLPDDVVEISLAGKKASLINILTPAANRATPPCQHFSQCGGCSFQHMQDNDYYQFKNTIFLEAVQRAGYDTKNAQDIVRIGQHSRRRIQLKAKHKGKQLGFNTASSHTIISLAECPIMDEKLFALLPPLQQLLRSLEAEVNAISLTRTDAIDMICESDSFPELQDTEKLATFARNHKVGRISWKEKSGITTIAEIEPITLTMGKVSVHLPADTFLQATQQGQDIMTQEAVSAVNGAKHVLDLYAGCGTFTFPIAENSNVHAIEGNRQMVETIQRAVSDNQLHGVVTAEMRDLQERPLLAKELKKYDAVVINPPRNGAEAQIEQLAASNIPTVFMVSCNPATFARDAALLQQAGYALTRAMPIDQFYWSKHLELVACFRKGD